MRLVAEFHADKPIGLKLSFGAERLQEITTDWLMLFPIGSVVISQAREGDDTRVFLQPEVFEGALKNPHLRGNVQMFFDKHK